MNLKDLKFESCRVLPYLCKARSAKTSKKISFGSLYNSQNLKSLQIVLKLQSVTNLLICIYRSIKESPPMANQTKSRKESRNMTPALKTLLRVGR